MKYTIYSKPDCPICEQAKTVFAAHSIDYNEVVIGQDVTRETVLGLFPGVRNAPVIVSPDNYEIPAQFLDMLLTLEERRLKNG